MALVSIATLNGRHQRKSVLRALDALWRESGHEVQIGKRYSSASDVAFLHHDLSLLDPYRVPTAPEGVPVVNGKALDIRKRGYSQLQIARDTDWDGMVLIKTNLNSFGMPERAARGWRATDATDWTVDLLARWNWKRARRILPPNYPLLEHVREVPEWVWQSPDHLVERFMPERDGPHYCLRGWMFLGSRSYGWRLLSNDPMVKTGSMVGHEYFDDVPEELEHVRAACQVDFGKIDYVVHDGRAIVLDVNKTPFFEGDPASPRLRDLALGIEDYLS